MNKKIFKPQATNHHYDYRYFMMPLFFLVDTVKGCKRQKVIRTTTENEKLVIFIFKLFR